MPLEGITELPEGKKGFLLFLDEFNHAPPSVVRAAYQIILDRKVGEYNLHPQTWIVAAGNLETDRALVNVIGKAADNRFFPHIYLKEDLGEWIENCTERYNINDKVTTYLMFNKGSLMKFDPKSKESNFASPRSWVAASNLANAMERKGGVGEHSFHLNMFTGTLGESEGQSFYSYCKVFSQLPDRKSIIRDPLKAIIPTDEATKFALLASLAGKFEDTDEIGPVCEYISRFSASLKTLYAIMSIKNNKTNGLLTHPEFIKLKTSVAKRLIA